MAIKSSKPGKKRVRSGARPAGPVPTGRPRQQPLRAASSSLRRGNIILTIALVALSTVMIGGAVLWATSSTSQSTSPAPAISGGGAASLVRDNSHRLSKPANAKVTLVEFLDFECEACRAAYPTVEKQRSEFGDRVNFVVRYFPIQSHFNALRAARAVEAAAQQGQFEAMYKKMYDTQTQWSEQQTPKDEVFRGFAAQLGLDMALWDAAYNAPETRTRIQQDIDDGTALGVEGTPTFFLNGQRIQPKSTDDLTEAIEAALAG